MLLPHLPCVPTTLRLRISFAACEEYLKTRDCLFQGRSLAIPLQGRNTAERRIAPHQSRRGGQFRSCLLPYMLMICLIVVLNRLICNSLLSPRTAMSPVSETTRTTHQTMTIIIPRLASHPPPPLHAYLNKRRSSPRYYLTVHL
jgi:hypothetical protein